MITNFDCFESETESIHPLTELVNKALASLTNNSTDVFSYLDEIDKYFQESPALQTEIPSSDLDAISNSWLDVSLLERIDVELYFPLYFRNYIYSQILLLDFRNLIYFLLKHLKPQKDQYLESFVTKSIMYGSINAIDMIMFEWMIDHPNMLIGGSNVLTLSLMFGRIGIAELLTTKYHCELEKFTDTSGKRPTINS